MVWFFLEITVNIFKSFQSFTFFLFVFQIQQMGIIGALLPLVRVCFSKANHIDAVYQNSATQFSYLKQTQMFLWLNI